eukprot:scaffold105053_cov18-Tisochrysis_lutea.AAC.2
MSRECERSLCNRRARPTTHRPFREHKPQTKRTEGAICKCKSSLTSTPPCHIYTVMLRVQPCASTHPLCRLSTMSSNQSVHVLYTLNIHPFCRVSTANSSQ